MNPFGDDDQRQVFLAGGEKDGQQFRASDRGQWANDRHPNIIWVLSGLGEQDIALNYPDGRVPAERLDELSTCAYRFDHQRGRDCYYTRAIQRDRPPAKINLPEQYLRPQSREKP